MIWSYSVFSRLQPSQTGCVASPFSRAARVSRCMCQPALNIRTAARSVNRRWMIVRSTSLPRGSSSKETVPLPSQVMASLWGGSSSVIRLCMRWTSAPLAVCPADRIVCHCARRTRRTHRSSSAYRLLPSTGCAGRSGSGRPKPARSDPATGAPSSGWRARSARHRNWREQACLSAVSFCCKERALL